MGASSDGSQDTGGGFMAIHTSLHGDFWSGEREPRVDEGSSPVAVSLPSVSVNPGPTAVTIKNKYIGTFRAAFNYLCAHSMMYLFRDVFILFNFVQNISPYLWSPLFHFRAIQLGLKASHQRQTIGHLITAGKNLKDCGYIQIDKCSKLLRFSEYM